MPSGEAAAKFIELFRGRENAYGGDSGMCIKQPVEVQTWYHHLDGRVPIGIYPLMDNGMVLWGCVDIDEGVDMIAMARNLVKAYKALGVTAWCERSRSKGYHVWTFFRAAVPAEDARNMGLVACQLAGVPPKEVNPKQTSLEGLKGYGNYVRLPYPKAHELTAKQVVLDLSHSGHNPPYVPLAEFVKEAWAARTDPAVVAKAAALYVPPPSAAHVDIAEYEGGSLDPLVKRMGGLAWTIFQHGPTEKFGYDRSRTLQRLAHLLREDCFEPGEALALLADADKRWGKFHDRADGWNQLQKMVTYAFGKEAD